MGAFVISKRLDDQYKYEFTSRKGKTIYTSIAYELKFECTEDIEFIKQNLEHCEFEKSKSQGGKFFFKMSLHGRFLAISRKYTTALRLEKGINEIVKYGAKSEILDFADSQNIFVD
jgi:uncharacterized protein